MQSLRSGLLWAGAILLVALASRLGMIARDDAANVILVLAVLSAIQIAAARRPSPRCAQSMGSRDERAAR